MVRSVRIVITTGRERSLAHELEAQALADRCGLAFASRADRRLEALASATGAEVLGIFGADGLVLWREGVKLRFSAGMAELRIKRVISGEHEPLVQLAGLVAGDSVLDCTLGLARDALVMAASGARVLGLEAVPLLASFCEAGLRGISGAAGSVAPRVRVEPARHAEFLQAAPPQSHEVVYFDPMFTDEIEMPPEYQLFRALADPAPLTRDVVEQARRVARRAVVIKDGPRGNLAKGLGLPLRELTFGNRVRYACIDPA
jgi:16S rRNA (guanine1516-N2)-methyltransferase